MLALTLFFFQNVKFFGMQVVLLAAGQDIWMIRGQWMMKAVQDTGDQPWINKQGNMNGILFLCSGHFKNVLQLLCIVIHV